MGFCICQKQDWERNGGRKEGREGGRGREGGKDVPPMARCWALERMK